MLKRETRQVRRGKTQRFAQGSKTTNRVFGDTWLSTDRIIVYAAYVVPEDRTGILTPESRSVSKA